MALLKDIFTKDKTAPLPRSSGMGIPTDEVSKLRQQGLSNDQIIQTLTRSGYGLDQINNAINMIDAKEGVESIILTPNERPKNEKGKEAEEFSALDQIGKDADMSVQQRSMPPPFSSSLPQPPMQSMPSAMSGPPPFQSAVSDEKLQEVAEAIIEEKWNDLLNHVNKVVEWKNTTESRIAQIEQQITDMRNEFDKLHQGVLERVGTYDQSMRDIGTELKALEKVFQKILPGFIENVNELGRISQGMKKK